MEAYKLVVELFRKFDVEVVNATKPWEEWDSLAFLHWNFMVRLTPREES